MIDLCSGGDSWTNPSFDGDNNGNVRLWCHSSTRALMVRSKRRREITPIYLCNLIKHQFQKQNTGQVPGICFRFNLFINLRCLMSFSSSIRWTTTATRSAVESTVMVGVSTNGRRFYSGVPRIHVSVQLLLCPCLFCGSFVGHFSVHPVVCCAGFIIVWRWLLSCSWHLLMRNS